MSQRVTRRDLATIWNLSVERIGQIDRAGKITKGSDGRYDLDTALRFRKAQVSYDIIRTLCQSYGSRYETVTGPKLDMALATEHRAMTQANALAPSRPSQETCDALIAFANFVLLDVLSPLPIAVRRDVMLDEDTLSPMLMVLNDDVRSGMAKIGDWLKSAGVEFGKVPRPRAGESAAT